MSTLSWEYVPSKTGVPRYCQVDRYEHSKKGWMKIPGNMIDHIWGVDDPEIDNQELEDCAGHLGAVVVG